MKSGSSTVKRPASLPSREDLGQLVDAVRHALAEPQPDRLRHQLAQLRRRALHLGEGAVDERGVALAVARERLAARPQAVDRVGAGAVDRRGEDPGELRQVVGDGEDVELVLRRELAVDQAAGDADLLRDRLDRGVEHAALVEERAGRGDERPLAHVALRGRLGLRRGLSRRHRGKAYSE